MENYLLNRKQKVVLDGYTSSLGSPSSGVPQGSVYINDISCDLTKNVRLFADDWSSPTLLQIILDRWSIPWLVDFKLKKTINLNFIRKKYKSFYY